MSRKIENECVGCTSMGLHCIGEGCRNRHVVRFYCDKCGEEFEPEALYVTDDEEFCDECLLNTFETVAQKERV